MTATRAPTRRCRCRRTRVDAFNITLANEFSRNGRRSGLTFAPEGGSDRLRKVINKMVTEDDLIRTVAAAYSHGWRQVKLYFMCGLPTETDEDVMQIGELAKRVIETGREVSGRNDIRCTVSIGGFVPKPHTPFQWAAQLDHETTDERLQQAPRPRCSPTSATARRSASATTTASPARSKDCCRAETDASAASSRPSGATAVVSTAGASTSRTTGGRRAPSRRWPTSRSTSTGTPTREREYAEVLPWDHLDAGLDRDWLWEDWQDAIDPDGAIEVEDCRWTPCFDCGVCPQMDTEIQIGPTGKTLLPLSVV